MVVNVKFTNGIRRGSFNINGIKGTFPIQSITSTNLNHTDVFEDHDFNFKTNIVEIVEFKPKKLVSDSEYRERRTKIVSEMIEAYPDKLFLFTLKGARATSYKTETGIKVTPFKFTKADNESLIDFQIECGFTLIKAFFKRVRNAMENSRHYRSLIPEGKMFVGSLDENMSHNTFRSLYLECLKKGDDIVSFFGRKPSKSKKQIHNQLNFAFISRRTTDNILRLTSFASKAIDGVVSSLIYNWYRFDSYSFMTRRGSQDIPNYEMKVLDGFHYIPLLQNTKLVCPITGKNLYESSKYFERIFDKSSLPVTIHDLVRLNEKFQVLHEEYTREKLQEILGDRI